MGTINRVLSLAMVRNGRLRCYIVSSGTGLAITPAARRNCVGLRHIIGLARYSHHSPVFTRFWYGFPRTFGDT